MTEVIFEENPITKRPKIKRRTGSGLENLLVRFGIFKTVAGARIALVIFIMITIIGIFLILHLQKSPGNSYGNYDQFIKEHPELVY